MFQLRYQTHTEICLGVILIGFKGLQKLVLNTDLCLFGLAPPRQLLELLLPLVPPLGPGRCWPPSLEVAPFEADAVDVAIDVDGSGVSSSCVKFDMVLQRKYCCVYKWYTCVQM